jgi:cellulose synthase/poly-beta-1,6-N-acetylglucosamine synthase-like glycosyltransferase
MKKNPHIFSSSILRRIKSGTLFKLFSALLAPIVLIISGIYLRNVIIHVSWSAIENAFFSISPQRLILAAILTILNYTVMIGYDLFGLRYAGIKTGLNKISAAAFIGDTLNANLGFSAFIGSAVKLKFYTRWGIPARAVIKAIAAYTIAHWLGFLFLASFSLLLQVNGPLSDGANLWKLSAGMLFGVPVVFYLIFVTTGKKLKGFAWLNSKLPDSRTGLLLLLTGVVDWTLTALLFFIVMPPSSLSQFPAFASMYTFSHLAGMLSQVPGGVAVFESVALIFAGTDKSLLLGPLFLFRTLFFLVPGIFGLIAFCSIEFQFNFIKRKIKKNRKEKIFQEYNPSVSIVIPAYNEEYSLSACLEAIKQQDYCGKMEIIVVDNASTDKTASIAKTMGATVYHEYQRGYNHAVKCGFDEASNEIIACTDADTIVPKDWISRLVESFVNDQVVACGGVFRFRDGSPFIRSIGIMGLLNYHIAGANMAVRRTAYKQVGGFSTTVNLGADVELGQRLKRIGKVVIDRSIVVATSPRRFQSAFWETIFRYYLNDLALLIRGKPLFYSFRDYRLVTKRSSRGMLSTAIITLVSILVVSGFLLENPSSQILGKVFAKARIDLAEAWTFNYIPGKITDTILNFLESHSARTDLFSTNKKLKQESELLKKK